MLFVRTGLKKVLLMSASWVIEFSTRKVLFASITGDSERGCFSRSDLIQLALAQFMNINLLMSKDLIVDEYLYSTVYLIFFG